MFGRQSSAIHTVFGGRELIVSLYPTGTEGLRERTVLMRTLRFIFENKLLITIIITNLVYDVKLISHKNL